MPLDHVTLAVRDLERSIRFYRDTIGVDLDTHATRSPHRTLTDPNAIPYELG